MERPIVKGELALRIPSVTATPMDLPVARDLLDTLVAHSDDCVGLAANMIGQCKRIIAYADQERAKNRVMINPEIVSESGPYETQEGCLSLVGKRSTKRFDVISVRYQDETFAWHTEEFHGYTAQIIQHEIDHCNGVVI